MQREEQARLVEAINAAGGLWFEAEYVILGGWDQDTASFAPTWGGLYQAEWEAIRVAFTTHKIIQQAVLVKPEWRGFRTAPLYPDAVPPIYPCCHL